MADEPTGDGRDAAEVAPAETAPPAETELVEAAPPPAETASAQAAAVSPPPAPRKARELVGVVLSNKADKTITVRIDRRVKHPVYGKFIRRSTKLAAHDPRNDCREGDVVALVETRPISRTKSWRLGRIVERAAS